MILSFTFFLSINSSHAQTIRLRQLERSPDSLYRYVGVTDSTKIQKYITLDSFASLLTISGSSKWTDVGSGNIYRNSLVSIATTADPTASLTIKKTAGNNVLRLINASDTSAWAVSISADPPNRRGFRSDGPAGIYQLNFPTDYTFDKSGLNITPGSGSAEGWATGSSSGSASFVKISATANPVGGSGTFSWLNISPVVNGTTSGSYHGISITKTGSGSSPRYNAIHSDAGNWIMDGVGHLKVADIDNTERATLTDIGPGSFIWNTTAGSAQVYDGSTWINFPGSGGGTVTSVGVASTDLSVSGSPVTTSGSITLNINNNAVTYAKMQTVAANRLLGNPTGSTANVTEIPLGAGLSFSGGSLVATNSGTVTSVAIGSTDLSISGSPITSSGTITLNINNNAVTTVKVLDANITYAKIQDVTAQRLVGRHAGTNGVMQEITLGSGLQWNGSSIESISGGSGTVTSVAVSSTDLSVSGSPITTAGTITLNINNSAVTYAKIQNVTQARILGRYTASNGVVQEISIGTGLALNSGTGVLSTTGGSGTVTSVGLTAPAQFTVTGTPVTTSGTISLAWANASANTIFAGPTTGSAAVPAFRSLVADDIPLLTGTLKVQMNTARILGRTTAGFGLAQEITIGTGLSLSAGTLSSTTTGTVTSVAVSSTDLSVSGSPITSSGTFTLNINNLAVTTAKINNNAVTFAKMQTVQQGRLLGRYSAGTGTVQEITLGSGLALNISTGELSGTGSSNWTLSSGLLYPNSTATNVAIGNTSTPSSSYKLYVNGITYTSSETYTGGVMTLSVGTRGFVNARMKEGGNTYGGFVQYSASGNTHGYTGVLSNQIFQSNKATTDGTTFESISNNESSSPMSLEGLQNNTTSRFSAAVAIRGYVRSGTGKVNGNVGDNMITLYNGSQAMLTINGEYSYFVKPQVLTAWNTAGRPTGGALVNGVIGYNTTTSKVEVYAAGVWVNLH